MSHEIRIPMNGDCRPIVRILTALFLIKTDYVTMTTMKMALSHAGVEP